MNLRRGDIQPIGLEALLIDEARHRHANEFASALAALHILKARTPNPPRIIEETIARLEANVRIERLLLDAGTDNPALAVGRLCETIAMSHSRAPEFVIRSIGRAATGESVPVRLLLLFAYELVTNAIKRSDQDPGRIAIRIVIKAGMLRLTVVNRIDEHRAAPGRVGNGIEILDRLADSVGGRLALRNETDRFVAQAMLPMQPGDRSSN